MKNVNKIIKFRKEDEHRYPLQHYIGMAAQSNQKPKKHTKPPMQLSPIANHKKPANQINQKQPLNYDHLISPQQKAPKHKTNLSHLQDSDYILSDNDEFVLSSVKKKPEKVKLSVPKMFEDLNVVQNYRKPVLNDIKKGDAVMTIDEIFAMDVMRKVMGLVPEEQRMVHKLAIDRGLKIVQENKLPAKMKVFAIKNEPEYIDVDNESRSDLQIIEQKSQAQQSHVHFGFSRSKSPQKQSHRNPKNSYEEYQQIEIQDSRHQQNYSLSEEEQQRNEYEMDFFSSQLYSYGMGVPEDEFMSFGGGGYNQQKGNHKNRQEKNYGNERQANRNHRDYSRSTVRNDDKDYRGSTVRGDNKDYRGSTVRDDYNALYSFGHPQRQFGGFVSRQATDQQGINFFSQKKPHYHDQYQQYDTGPMVRGNQSQFISGSQRGYPFNNNRKKREQEYEKMERGKKRGNERYSRR